MLDRLLFNDNMIFDETQTANILFFRGVMFKQMYMYSLNRRIWKKVADKNHVVSSSIVQRKDDSRN